MIVLVRWVGDHHHQFLAVPFIAHQEQSRKDDRHVHQVMAWDVPMAFNPRKLLERR